MSGPLYHDEDIYKIFPSDRHKDTEYGYDDLVKGYSCMLKYDIDSDITDLESRHHPEIRVDIKVLDINNPDRFWYAKYKIGISNIINGFTQETKDDFMIKVIPLVKENILENQDVGLPKSNNEYIEMK